MRKLSRSIMLSAGRAGRRLGLLSGAALGAVIGAGQPADAIVITPNFDTCWMMGCTIGATTISAAPAAATAAVNKVIQEYDADFTNVLKGTNNPVAFTIQFGWGESQGTIPPANTAVGIPNGLTQYTLAATKGFYANGVGLQPTNVVLNTANANLPATFNNPSGGSSMFLVGDTEYLALNGVAQNADTIAGFTGYSTTLCNANGTCPGSFTALVEHEISHAMGRFDQGFVSPFPSILTPLDFFKYVDNAGRCGKTLDPTFNITCFSYDGGATNPGGRTFSNKSDSGDWINFPDDSYNFSVSNTAVVSTADLQLMCALGWNDCTAQQLPEPSTIALLGASLLGLAALRRRRI